MYSPLNRDTSCSFVVSLVAQEVFVVLITQTWCYCGNRVSPKIIKLLLWINNSLMGLIIKPFKVTLCIMNSPGCTDHEPRSHFQAYILVSNHNNEFLISAITLLTVFYVLVSENGNTFILYQFIWLVIYSEWLFNPYVLSCTHTLMFL